MAKAITTMNLLPLTNVSTDTISVMFNQSNGTQSGHLNDNDTYPLDINKMHSTYDRSNLNIIDADINYWKDVNNIITSKYYNENNFNMKFKKNDNFSLIHMNIRSVRLHFSEFLSYLSILNIDFSIIALSETAINSNDIDYIIPTYNVEMNYRKKKKGGGVSLYIHSTLQYKNG